MNRISIFIFFLVFLSACSSSSRLIKPQFKPEFSIELLNQKRIAAINPNYKKNYFRLMPYLFYNRNNTFNEIQGDFYNVDYRMVSNINIMTGYWSEYGKYKNALIVLIAMSGSSKLPLKGVPISVESSKHGIFQKGKLNDNEFNRVQERVLFVKELELENKYDVLNKVYDDVITVQIGGQIYEFLNPELELD